VRDVYAVLAGFGLLDDRLVYRNRSPGSFVAFTDAEVLGPRFFDYLGFRPVTRDRGRQPAAPRCVVRATTGGASRSTPGLEHDERA